VTGLMEDNRETTIFVSVPRHDFFNHSALLFTLYLHLSLSITNPPSEELKLVTFTFMISGINIVTSKNLIFDIKNEHCY